MTKFNVSQVYREEVETLKLKVYLFMMTKEIFLKKIFCSIKIGFHKIGRSDWSARFDGKNAIFKYYHNLNFAGSDYLGITELLILLRMCIFH